jgi:hypothetical protein
VSYTLKLGEGRKAHAEVAATGIGDSPLESVEVGQSPMLGNGKMGRRRTGKISDALGAVGSS